jgi:hypothetical protein
MEPGGQARDRAGVDGRRRRPAPRFTRSDLATLVHRAGRAAPRRRGMIPMQELL